MQGNERRHFDVTKAHERYACRKLEPMNPNKALWEEGDFARIAQSMRAAADGRATELQAELEALFNSQNTSPSEDATSIPATFLRVTVTP